MISKKKTKKQDNCYKKNVYIRTISRSLYCHLLVWMHHHEKGKFSMNNCQNTLFVEFVTHHKLSLQPYASKNTSVKEIKALASSWWPAQGTNQVFLDHWYDFRLHLTWVYKHVCQNDYSTSLSKMSFLHQSLAIYVNNGCTSDMTQSITSQLQQDTAIISTHELEDSDGHLNAHNTDMWTRLFW